MGTPCKSTLKTWKEKAITRSKQMSRLQSEVKRQQERAANWRRKYYELERRQRLTKIKHHHYPLELIWLSVYMHIHFNISLRGVSQILCKISELFGLSIDYISPSSIRNWCLKYGYSCLQEEIPSGQYVVICDESIQINREQLMLILLVPVDKMSYYQPLKMNDILVLSVSVQHSWKADDLSKILQQKCELYGLDLIYGIADKSSVLRKAYRDCGIIWVEDCTHYMANVAKSLFKGDDDFNGFIQQINALRAKWIMSIHNFYIPPGLRAKARFHQIFTVHQWVDWVLVIWDSIPEHTRDSLYFVKEAQQTTNTLRHLCELTEGFANIFKARGIQVTSQKEWQKWVQNYKGVHHLCKRSLLLIEKLNDYLEKQIAKFDTNTQILCCSDIIESMFGKYKNKGGAKIITDDILKIAAYPKKPNQETIKKCMENVKLKIVKQWKKDNTITSKIALRKRAKKQLKEVA